MAAHLYRELLSINAKILLGVKSKIELLTSPRLLFFERLNS